MDQVFKCGQTMPNMKVSGARTKPMAKASSGTQMATFMKDSGKTTRPMVTAYMCTLTEPNMRATGKTTFRTALALRAGQMARSTKAAIKRA